MELHKNKTKQELIEQLTMLQKQYDLLLKQQSRGGSGGQEYFHMLDAIEDGYWEVDLKGNITLCTSAFARIIGYPQNELIGVNYRSFLERNTAKEVLKHYNTVYRTGTPSKASTFSIVRDDGTRLVVDISVSLIRDGSGEPAGFRGIMRDITEQHHAVQLKENIDKLRKTFGQMAQSLSVAIELRDPYTAGHHRRVSDLSRSIATELGLPGNVIDGIRIAGALHDIGKISVPSEILNKPGALTEIEFKLVKNHTTMGFDILKKIDFPWPVAKIVYQHHEEIDGSGYPSGITGDEMLIESKIIAVANKVDAMSSHRTYRKPITIAEALDKIMAKRGILYDPDVVDACHVLFKTKGYVWKE